MSYRIVKAEITRDPLGRGYAGMTATSAQESLLVVNRPRSELITPELFIGWAEQGARAMKLLDAIEDKGRARADRAMCWRLMAILEGQALAELPQARAAGLEERGIISAGDLADLEALFNRQQSRAQEIGCQVMQRQADGSRAPNVRYGWLLRAGLPEG